MRKPLSFALVSAVVCSWFFVSSSYPLTSALQGNLWETNGPVYATAISGDTLYVGGEFTYVGPHTGHGVAIESSSGSYDPLMPKVNGVVYAVVPDGSGGWFIGGDFTSVGGEPRNKIAHISPDKTVDAGWNPNANTSVRALAVSYSNGTIYFGGDFTLVSGRNRSYLAGFQDPTSVEPEVHIKPVEERMFLASYPNLFSGAATIEYGLREESHVILRVYDVAGREVIELVNGGGKAGRSRVNWKGVDRKGNKVPSGIYFSQLRIGERIFTKKMMLTR